MTEHQTLTAQRDKAAQAAATAEAKAAAAREQASTAEEAVWAAAEDRRGAWSARTLAEYPVERQKAEQAVEGTWRTFAEAVESDFGGAATAYLHWREARAAANALHSRHAGAAGYLGQPVEGLGLIPYRDVLGFAAAVDGVLAGVARGLEADADDAWQAELEAVIQGPAVDDGAREGILHRLDCTGPRIERSDAHRPGPIVTTESRNRLTGELSTTTSRGPAAIVKSSRCLSCGASAVSD